MGHSSCGSLADRHSQRPPLAQTIDVEVEEMIQQDAQLLVLWAFITGVTFLALLVFVMALVYRWAAPAAD